MNTEEVVDGVGDDDAGGDSPNDSEVGEVGEAAPPTSMPVIKEDDIEGCVVIVFDQLKRWIFN